MEEEYILKFFEVSKVYKDKNVLSFINFALTKGEFLLIKGGNKSGKSLILKLIYKEASPSEGEIFLFGHSLLRIKNNQFAKIRKKIGVISEETKFFNKANVFDNVAIALELRGIKKSIIREKTNDILSKLKLLDKSQFFPFELSLSNKQKVKIARALISSPEILVADEPFLGMDDKSKVICIDLFCEYNKNGTSFVFASNSRDDFSSFAPLKEIVIDDGKIQEFIGEKVV